MGEQQGNKSEVEKIQLAQTVFRLGALMGPDGVKVSEAVAQMALEAIDDPASTFNGPIVYVKTSRNPIVLPNVHAVHDISGSHFDFMLEQAADIVSIVTRFFADHEQSD